MTETVSTRGGHLVVDDVGKVYRSARGEVVAVDGCSLEVAPGELHVIVGPSGCGKTTLLNAVAGFSDITAGEIHLDDRLLCGPSQPSATPGADRVVVFQDSTLFPWRTVVDNVAYGPIVQGRLDKAEATARARERLAQADLAEVADRFPAELSSGVQRRVELLRALFNDPSVLLLDEPFRGMDAIARSLMHEALLDLYDRSGVTVLFITHDIEEAVLLGSHVSVMSTRPGRIKTTVDITLERPRTTAVITSPPFRALVAEVSEAVRGEARQAFEAGERELAR
jgi:NitT/TauT family transport system ATP-binding protein